MAAPDRSSDRDHPALRAWANLAGDTALAGAIERITEGRKVCVYVLPGVGPGGGHVIAKRTRKGTAGLERRIYEGILRDAPVASLGFYGAVEDPDPGFGWLFLEDAGNREYTSTDESHRCSMARWLAALHVHASHSRGAAFLPDRGPAHYLSRLRATRSTVRSGLEQGALAEDQRRLLERIAARFDGIERDWESLTRICERFPSTLVHGDLSDKNVRTREAGAGVDVVAFDWEMAGWGSPAVDLAQLELRPRGSLVAPDLRTYASAVDPGWLPDGERGLRTLAAVGSIFRVVSLIDWMVWSVALGLPGGAMSRLTLYDEKLREIAVDPVWEAHRAWI